MWFHVFPSSFETATVNGVLLSLISGFEPSLLFHTSSQWFVPGIF
jgi:hypothetical protein